MFRTIFCPSSGAQECRTSALQTTDRQQFGYIIPHAVSHSLALPTMGKKLPETCWAHWKINILLLLHLVGPLHYLYRWCTVKHIKGIYCMFIRSIKKCTLVQALRLCTGRTAHRGSRGIALLFLDHGIKRGWRSASRPGRFLPPGKDPVPIV